MTTTTDSAASRTRVTAAARCASIARALLGYLPARWYPRLSGAQARYFALDEQAAEILGNLGTEDDPAKRAVLLDDLAACEQAMADIYPEAFGPDPIEAEGGRDMAHSGALSAHLIRLVAATEHDLAGTSVVNPVAWDPELDEHMACLRTERDRTVRAVLLEDLCDAVADQVGGQAAETLASLAYAERRTARRSS